LKLRELVKSQSTEISRLKNLTEEYEIAVADSKREAQSLRKDLEEALAEQHRLEDELELQQHEVNRMNQQMREIQRSIIESQKLAQNEV
jgi:predicted  nucleic acid-binding Zn-ribbon protein